MVLIFAGILLSRLGENCDLIERADHVEAGRRRPQREQETGTEASGEEPRFFAASSLTGGVGHLTMGAGLLPLRPR